jgi:hypothetical protein
MDDANLKASLGESSLWYEVKVARSFHSYNDVFDVVLFLGFADLSKRNLEEGSLVLERLRRNKDIVS